MSSASLLRMRWRDLALRIQQAAGFEQRPFRVGQTAGNRRHRLAIRVHRLARRIQHRLQFRQRHAQRPISRRYIRGLRTGNPALAIGVVEPSFDASGEDIVERNLPARGDRLVRHEHQSQQPLAELVDHDRAHGHRVIARAAIGIARLVNHDRGHAADRPALREFAMLHARHQHRERVVALIGNHVRRGHADGLRIGEDAVRVVLPHLDQAAEIVPAADVGTQQPAPEDPGDRRQITAAIAFLVENLDLEGAGGNPDDAFHPRQQLLDDEGFARRLHFRDVKVHAGASALQRLVVVEHPENDHRNQAGHRLAVDGDVFVDARECSADEPVAWATAAAAD